MLKTVFSTLNFCLTIGLGTWVVATHQSQGSATQIEKADPPVSLSLYRGVAAPVRKGDEDEVTDSTRKISYEAYYDWDFGTLTLLTETGSIAVMPAPRNWELRTTPVAGGIVALSFLSGTGQAWLLSEDEKTEEASWRPIEDSVALEMGDYDVQITADENGISALRFDRLSGRSWSLAGFSWRALAGNLQDEPVEGKGK